MAGRRLTWGRKHGPTEQASPKDYDKARGLRGATYGPASEVRTVKVTPELAAQYGATVAEAWMPWRELGPDDRVPMTGEPYTAITCGGRMWERRR